ncbi:MAG: potassium channel family protein [Bacillota bacterium]
MYIIIVGCGSVGGRLANLLSEENHNIVVIDANSESFNILEADFNGITIEGNGIDEQVLKEAGVTDADALLAMTDDDNTNIMAGQVAKNLFNVSRVVTRVNNQERESLYRTLGLETINITKLGAFEVRNLLFKNDFKRCLIDDEAGVDIISYKVGERLAGESVLDLEIGDNHLLSIIRDGKVVDSSDNQKLQLDDRVILAATDHNYGDVLSLKEEAL